MANTLPLKHDDALRELLDRTSRASRELVELVTLPIAGDRHGHYTQHQGTGELLKIADNHFLLTAAHVLRTIRGQGERPFLLFPYKTELPIPLTYVHVIEEADIDVAIALLDERTVRRLEAHYRFMQLSNVWSPRQDLELGVSPLFMLTGYAGDRVQKDPDGTRFCNPWRFKTGLYERPETMPGYDADRHWVFHYPDEIRIGANNWGYNIDPPGMSGCGVWAILQSVPIANWTSEYLKLSGLLLGWDESNKYVVGAKVAVPLYTIWCNFPDTRDALREFGVGFEIPNT